MGANSYITSSKLCLPFSQELEDAVCDMVLAVAGGRTGITAAQLTANAAGVRQLLVDTKHKAVEPGGKPATGQRPGCRDMLWSVTTETCYFMQA